MGWIPTKADAKRWGAAVAAPTLTVASNVVKGIGGAAVAVTGAVAYVGAGGVRYLADGTRFEGSAQEWKDMVGGATLGGGVTTLQAIDDLNPLNEDSELRLATSMGYSIYVEDEEAQNYYADQLTAGESGWESDVWWQISGGNLVDIVENPVLMATYEVGTNVDSDEDGDPDYTEEQVFALMESLDTYGDAVILALFGPGVIKASIKLAFLSGGLAFATLSTLVAAIQAGTASVQLINMVREALGLTLWSKDEEDEEEEEEILEEEEEPVETFTDEPPVVVEEEIIEEVVLDVKPFWDASINEPSIYEELEKNW